MPYSWPVAPESLKAKFQGSVWYNGCGIFRLSFSGTVRAGSWLMGNGCPATVRGIKSLPEELQNMYVFWQIFFCRLLSPSFQMALQILVDR